MLEAKVDGELIQANPESPEVAQCPACGGEVHKRKQSRATVELTIQDLVWQLPKCYTDTLYRQKSAVVYQHVYDSYYGAGQSVYAMAG